MSYDTKTLPTMDNLREGSLEDISDLAASRNYPYLSNSTYSLPRNHKLYKSNSTRRYAPTFRESQETLLRNSSECLYPESRETLLNRYPSSGRNTPGQSPSSSRPSSPQTPSTQRRATPSYGLQPSYSSSAFPPEYQNYHPHHHPQPHHPPHHPHHHPHHHQPPPVMEGSRRGYQGEVRHREGYHSDYDYRRSVPVSPSSSLRSSRAASPSAPRPASSYSRRSSPASQSRRSSPKLTRQEYRRPAKTRLQEVTSQTTSTTTGSPRSSRTSSARSSRASSPRPGPGPRPGPDNQTLERMLVAARQQTQTPSDQKSKIVYVRE